MLVRLAGHLRQMGHAQHLPSLPQAFQQAPHNFGDGAADAAIDFVEDQGRRGGGVRGDDGNGQRDARQFAAGRHLGQRTGRRARMAGDEKFHLLEAVRGRCARVQGDLEAAARHAQFLHGARDGVPQLQGGGAARGGQSLGHAAVFGLDLRFLAQQAVDIGSVGQVLQLFRQLGVFLG